MRLTVIWLFANARISACGVLPRSDRVFTFETGLSPSWLDKALSKFPYKYQVCEGLIWVRSYIREQFGSGENLRGNRMALVIVREVLGLPTMLQEKIFSFYPELTALLPPKGATPQASKGMASPSTPLHKPIASPPHGDSKGMASPRVEQSRVEQSTSEQGSTAGKGGAGEKPPPPKFHNAAGGDEVCLPVTVEEAVAMCSTLAVPVEFIREVFDQCAGRGFHDGAGVAVKSFVRHVAHRWTRQKGEVNGAANGKHVAQDQPGWALERKLKTMQEALEVHPANPQGRAYSSAPTEAERKDFKEGWQKMKAIKQQLKKQEG